MFLKKIHFILLLTSLLTPFLSANSSYPESVKTKKIYPMGKKIYEKKCSTIDIKSFANIDQLFKAIGDDKLCKIKNKKQLEAVTLYLWEVKRQDLAPKPREMHIHENDKCPVCGMFVYKFPKWAAQLFYEDTHYSFDGVKDLMKYYFKHKDGIKEMLVRDYYTQKVIDGLEAYYVVGSDVYGPMGNELIPFTDEKSAKTFYMDHKGKEVLQFKDITAEIVNNL